MTAFLHQSLRIAVPYVLAALGGTVCELGGVINIALEGLILAGAFGAAIGAYYTGSPWLGLLAALAAGAAVAAVHGAASIRWRVNQIISGLAINMAVVGLAKFFLKLLFHSASNSAKAPALPAWVLLSATALLVPLVHWVVYRTRFGLRLRAVGEHPECADTLGVDVARLRYAGVILSGLLAALGGAWLAFDQRQYTDGMSGGRGYIALSALIFGKWTPLGAAGAALLFGLAESLQIHLQTVGVKLPTQVIQMIPYLLTVVVLAGAIGRARPPKADGLPYPSDDNS